MLSALVALAAASGVCLMDEGTLKACSVETLKCEGAGVTCSIVNKKGVISISGGVSDAGAVTTYPPGLPPFSVQYACDGGGSFCGAANVFSDGGHLGFIGMIDAHPPVSTSANHRIVYDWLAATGMPALPLSIDPAMGIPMPAGIMAPFNLLGTAANWRVTGCLPVGFGSATLAEVGDTGTATCAVVAGSCTASGPNWATTNLRTRGPITTSTKTTASAANVWCGHSYLPNPAGFFWRGTSAGEGGFFLWSRVFIDTAPGDNMSVNKMFVGFFSGTALPSAATEPSSRTDVAYFGGDTNAGAVGLISFCTNDNAGTASCSSLGAGFPIISGAWYDLYMWAPPAASSIYGGAVRLDSAQNSGLLTASSNLPTNTTHYTTASLLGSTNDDAGPTAISNGGFLVLWNY